MSERPEAEPDSVSVARFLPRTLAEGPGLRTALWVQGCSIHCPGCFNPHLLGFRGGTRLTPEELVSRVLRAETQGLTLLGGEPFDQAPGLARVAAGVRAAGRSVMTFTGYTRSQLDDEIAAGRPGIADLLAETDLLASGPFLRDHLDHDRPWVGSTNQELVALSDRLPALVDRPSAVNDRLEVRVDASGGIAVNGWADPDLLDALLSECGG